MEQQERAPVRRWHEAVNAQDLELAGEAVTDDVRVGGPKGANEGRDVFLEWVESAGINLVPVGWHGVDAERVVVEQDATWPGNPKAAGQDPIRVATLFRVEGGRVAEALRYGSLDEALGSIS